MVAVSGTTRYANTPTPPIDLLWYAPHPHIRTRGAAIRAREMAESLKSAADGHDGYSERELFTAMHTCAYQAAPRARKEKMSPARQRKWAKRWQIIRGHLYESNLGLAKWWIGRHLGGSVDEDDLHSEVMLALLRAVDRFNPWKGYRFSTYATNAIARAVMRLGGRENRRQRTFTAIHPEDEPQAVIEHPELEQEVRLERLDRVLRTNQAALTPLEACVIRARFPRVARREKSQPTYTQIGEMVGMSKESVRQAQNRALEKLRAVLECDPVLQ